MYVKVVNPWMGAKALLRYVALYNHQLVRSALKSKTPMQAMKEWYQEYPDLFHKRPYDRPECDIYVPDWDKPNEKHLVKTASEG